MDKKGYTINTTGSSLRSFYHVGLRKAPAYFVNKMVGLLNIPHQKIRKKLWGREPWTMEEKKKISAYLGESIEVLFPEKPQSHA